jgi:steroid delta-isomerase-like uncharacterized protein
MKPVFASSILLSIGLPLCGILSAQENSANQSDHSSKELKMSVAQTPEKNKEGVRKLYEDILNTGKLELLNQIIAEEYVGAFGQKGPSGFAGPIQELRQGFPDIKYTIEGLMAEGERVAVRWKWRGTHTGSFRGFAASQKQVTNEGIAIFQFRDSKVVHSWIMTDRLGFLQQIGVVSQDLGSVPQPPNTLPAVRHISVSINRPLSQVYDFASNPENLAKWATGLGGSIKNVNGEWIADAPMGKVKIKFAESNTFGILDHDVILESGVRIHNPMRVVPNGSGSEVVFMLFRQPDMLDEKFSEDAKWVEKDLRTLKDLLEE